MVVNVIHKSTDAKADVKLKCKYQVIINITLKGPPYNVLKAD